MRNAFVDTWHGREDALRTLHERCGIAASDVVVSMTADTDED